MPIRAAARAAALLLLLSSLALAAPFPGRKDPTPLPPGKNPKTHITGDDFNGILDALAGATYAKNHGAKCDGANDDTAKIQAAVTEATGTVVLPPGTCLTSAPITSAKSGVRIVGSGPGATIVKAAPGFSGSALFVLGNKTTTAVTASMGLAGMTLHANGQAVSGLEIYGLRDGSHFSEILVTGMDNAPGIVTGAAGNGPGSATGKMNQGVTFLNVHVIGGAILHDVALWQLDGIFESTLIGCKALGYSLSDHLNVVGFRIGHYSEARGVALIECSAGNFVGDGGNVGVHYGQWARNCWDTYTTFENIKGVATLFHGSTVSGTGLPFHCQTLFPRVYISSVAGILDPVFKFGDANYCHAGPLWGYNSTKVWVRFDAPVEHQQMNSAEIRTNAASPSTIGTSLVSFDPASLSNNIVTGTASNAVSGVSSGFRISRFGLHQTFPTGRVVIPFAATLSVQAGLGDHYEITATNSGAHTIATPTNGSPGQQLTITFKRATATLGTTTWGPAYKLAGVWVQPADGHNRSITFRFDGAVWAEVSRTPVDVPNDGSAVNHSAAIQARITAAAASNGVVELPAGTFDLTAQLNMASGVTLRGAGTGNTILRVAAGSQIRAVVAQNVSDWTIADLTIDTNKANTTDAGSDSNQQAIYVLATNSAGVKRARIENVRAMNGHRIGINLSSSDTASPGAWPTEVDIVGCRVEGYARNGIYANRANGVRLLNSEITGSGAEGVNFNRSQKFLISGNDVHDNGWHGIVANTDSRDFQIIGNRSFDNDVAQTHGANNGIGIVASVNARNFVIANNRADHNGGQGISLDVKLPDVSPASGSVTRAGSTVTVTAANSVAVGDTLYLKSSTNAALFPPGEKVVVTASPTSFTYTEAGTAGSSTVGLAYVNTTQVEANATVTGNVASNNLYAHGIYAQFLKGLTLTGNQTFGNAESGIYVTAARDVAISGNTSRGNAKLGIGISEAVVAAEGYAKATDNVRIGANALSGNGDGDFALGAPITGRIFYGGALRATTTIDLPQILTNACTHTNVTVTGAVIGAECSAGHPSGAPDQTFTTCHVDAVDTVDLHVCNLGAPYDPPSATYSVRVFNP